MYDQHFKQVIDVLKKFLVNPAPVLIKLKRLQESVTTGNTSIAGLSGTIPRRKNDGALLSGKERSEFDGRLDLFLLGDGKYLRWFRV